MDIDAKAVARTRQALRREKSSSIVDEFFSWIEKQAEAVVPGTPLATAVNYAKRLRVALSRFLEDRRIELDTWKNMGPYLTSVVTKTQGWGYMEAKVWKELADVYLDLQQITRPVSPEEVMTLDVWQAAKMPKV